MAIKHVEVGGQIINVDIQTRIDQDNREAVIRAGDKTMVVEVSPCGKATDALGNTGNSSDRRTGITTAMYTVAKGYLQTTAQELDHPVIYEHRAMCGVMQAWQANQTVFEWQSVRQDPDQSSAIVVINPTK